MAESGALTHAVLLMAALSGGCSALLSTNVSRPNAMREFPAKVRVHDEA